ncbi:MAG: polysaccharide biosynthesis tyrosine autokinase, partial [Muribaculaceae bacterium]|nr:polysaccharide biosynthesis tyrosine autokinase [Muribaculaceae bacterium]
MQEIIQESTPSNDGGKKRNFSASIPIKAFFRACLHNWYWFVISAIICTCIALLKTKSEPKLYNTSALIMLTTETSKQHGSQAQVFGDLGMNVLTTDLGNEIHKVKSTRLMEDVVNHLGLNIQYYGRVYLRDVNTYKHSPVQITPLKDINSNYTVSVLIKGDNDFEYSINGSKTWKKAHFGNKVSTPYGPVAVTKTRLFNNQYEGYTVIAKVGTTNSVAKNLKANLTVEQADKLSDMLKLSIVTDNHELGVDVLNALIVAYNQDGIEDKNRVARNTENFIAERINAISKDLSGVDRRIAQLKTASSNDAIYADPSSGARYQENASDASLQLSLATGVRDFLNSTSNHDLIPSNTGIANAGIENQIKEYNEAMVNYQKIAATSTDENPVMIELRGQLDNMRGGISKAINNYISQLSAKQSQAEAQAVTAQAGRQQMPGHEKAITEVGRQQNVKEQLYLYLLNKREENALQIAITEPNAKIIEPATGSPVPFSPVTSRTMAIGFLIGLLIPAAILYLIYWLLSLDTKIHGRRDVEENCNLPILGEIPSKRSSFKNKEVIVSEDSVDRVSEALRIVRANLDFVTDHKDGSAVVMQFTSTRPGEGKSFVALNLALTCAHVNKKVVVVDLDLRKGRFSDYVDVDSAVGVSAYLSGKVTNLDDVICKGVLHQNLDVVPIGVVPPNPTGLLMGNHLKELIDELRKKYDYIILDTVPFGMIADASLINRYVDLTVY